MAMVFGVCCANHAVKMQTKPVFVSMEVCQMLFRVGATRASMGMDSIVQNVKNVVRMQLFPALALATEYLIRSPVLAILDTIGLKNPARVAKPGIIPLQVCFPI